MKITSIKQQEKRADRYSIFVEGKYAFSLSETALLDSKLASGKEVTKDQLKEFKRLSVEDKLYGQALRWLAMRPRTEWEVRTYLERKQASPEFVVKTLNKLSKIELIDDERFARTFMADRRLLKPTSRRKLMAELRQKRVPSNIIDQVQTSQTDTEEISALRSIITKKRAQAKYQDNLRLMQYLARQGFSYDDIKQTLSEG